MNTSGARAGMLRLRRARIVWGVSRRYPLPPALRPYTPTEKWLWHYIHVNGEDEYSARGLAEEVGSDKKVMNYAMARLLEDGWLVEVRAPAGRRPGLYQAVTRPVSAGEARTSTSTKKP